MTQTPEQIALDIYKTIPVSLRNDAFAECAQRQFVVVVAPIIRAAVAAEKERAAQIVDHQLSHYPADVFLEPPPGEHGTTVDACSARALRAILPVVAERIRARGETERAG